MNYKTIRFEAGFRIDLLVDNKVLVEIKAVEKLLNRHSLVVSFTLRKQSWGA